jgi:hypothetical protein
MDQARLSHVECVSGSRYGERPLAFTWDEERLEVAGVQRQWRTPRGMCYRVITQDERTFDLFYLEDDDVWKAVNLS